MIIQFQLLTLIQTPDLKRFLLERGETDGDRQRQREKETETDTERRTQRDGHRETDTERERDRETGQSYPLRGNQTG